MKARLTAVALVVAATFLATATEAGGHHPSSGFGKVRGLSSDQPYPADAQAAGARAPNPLIGAYWGYNTNLQAARFTAQLIVERRHREADLMRKITDVPRFYWLGRHNADPRRAVAEYLWAPAWRGLTTGMVVYAHEGEQCRRGYDGGGRRGERRYRRWMREFAAAISSQRVVIAFEPDSLGTMRCLSPGGRRSRLRNLRFGVDLLSKLPNATVYIEAGASDWRPAREIARYLRYVGVHKVRGFMLNVTHFDWTRNNVRYGARLSRMLGGKHFVVNTDENGRGPLRYRRRDGRRVNVWCNPRNSGLGLRPTLHTRHPKADGFLWISRPGVSAGPCKGWPRRYSATGPPAGFFFPQRALMLAERASRE